MPIDMWQPNGMDYDLKPLKAIASRSLLENVIETDEGAFVRAGGHQFRSLWTRDFCFAVAGLVAIGRNDIAKNHLQMLIDKRRPIDALVPRVLESGFGSALRVIKGTINQKVSMFILSDPKSPLKPEYHGEHKTISIDSNLLVLLSCFLIKDEQFLNLNRNNFKKLYDFYDSKFDEGMIYQGAYEDWQDSVKRQGKTSYINILYIIVSEIAYQNNYFEVDLNRLQNLKKLFVEKFWDNNLQVFKSIVGEDLVGLDTNLLICDYEIVFSNIKPMALYKNLKKTSFWNLCGMPGTCSNLNYPESWVSWTTKSVGLNDYHGLMHWSWLMGYSAKAAFKMGDRDEAVRILANIQELAKRDDAIYEIYKSTSQLLPYTNRLYKSEYPFSWGAGKILEAIEVLER